jgi:hypothetical protein
VTAYFDEHRILHAHAVYEFSMLFYKIIWKLTCASQKQFIKHTVTC